MAKSLDELELAEKIFLVAEYSTILEEMGAGKSQGQVVRRMVQEGYGMESALSLYAQLAVNSTKSEEVVQSLRRQIEDARNRQFLQELLSKPQTTSMSSSDLARISEAEENKERMGELARHIFPHLLMKIFGI
ncbi:MAG: hypothetical protein Q8937_04280 [Bacteroidota bacterium]|nr:hypothetical protein [Bacteroidota bacterium]MDP4257427.1 hypothetical protein [Bacteroidota bacterium]